MLLQNVEGSDIPESSSDRFKWKNCICILCLIVLYALPYLMSDKPGPIWKLFYWFLLESMKTFVYDNSKNSYSYSPPFPVSQRVILPWYSGVLMRKRHTTIIIIFYLRNYMVNCLLILQDEVANSLQANKKFWL